MKSYMGSTVRLSASARGTCRRRGMSRSDRTRSTRAKLARSASGPLPGSRHGELSRSGLQLENAEWRAEDRLGDVADGDAARREALFAPPMGVAVQHEIGAGAIDRLGEQVAAEERVDLDRLPAE